jgi:hypothetical protein
MRARATTLIVVVLALVFGGAVGVVLAVYGPWPWDPSHDGVDVAKPSRSEGQPFFPSHLRAADLNPRTASPSRLRLSKRQAARFSPWRDPADDPELAPARGELPIAHHRVWLGRRVSSVMTYTGFDGKLCVIEHLPPEGGVFHCIARRRLFRDSAVYFEVASSQALRRRHGGWDLVWLWGMGSARVAHLNVILSNCSERRVLLDRDRVFFVVFGPKLLRKGIEPELLVGRDGDRSIIFRRRVHVGQLDDQTTPRRTCRSIREGVG